MHTIQGTHEDSVGQLIAGYFGRATGSSVAVPYSSIGWISDSKIVGQALFTEYTESNIDIHIFMPNKLTKKAIRDIAHYVFITSNCNRLTAKPEATNEKLLQLLPRLGFEYEFTQKDYYGPVEAPVDAVVFKLTKKNALRWINV